MNHTLLREVKKGKAEFEAGLNKGGSFGNFIENQVHS